MLALQYWVALTALAVGIAAAYYFFKVRDKNGRIALAGLALVGFGFSMPNFQSTAQRLRAVAEQTRRVEAQREQARAEERRRQEAEANRTFTISITTRQNSTIGLYREGGWSALEEVKGRKAKFTVKRGEYEVKVEAEGYWPKVVPANVTDRNRNLAVALERNPTGQIDVLGGRGENGVRATVRQPDPATAADVYYANCSAARAAGAAPIMAGEPGYRSRLDRDGDGVACE